MTEIDKKKKQQLCRKKKNLPDTQSKVVSIGSHQGALTHNKMWLFGPLLQRKRIVHPYMVNTYLGMRTYLSYLRVVCSDNLIIRFDLEPSFFALPTIWLRYQSSDVRFDNESQSGPCFAGICRLPMKRDLTHKKQILKSIAKNVSRVTNEIRYFRDTKINANKSKDTCYIFWFMFINFLTRKIISPILKKYRYHC